MRRVTAQLRRHRAYRAWSAVRELQELRAFNGVLDEHLPRPHGSRPYDLAALPARLAAKAGERRPFLAPDGRPVVAAFGARVWEQYGLWPSFERRAGFGLSLYGEGEGNDGSSKESDEERRTRQAEGFLRFVDRLDGERRVTCAFFYASGAHISDHLLAELHRRGIWTVVMSLDDKQQFFRPRDPRTNEPHQLRVARQCDLYWTTWRGGTRIISNVGGTPWYAAEGADPLFHHPLGVERDLDVVFVGAAYGMRGDLVRYLRERGFDVHAYGAGWPNGFVDFEETVRLFSRAKVVLGVGGVGHMRGIKHLKGRDFEVPMCGAVYLTSYNPELTDHFVIGEEILCYSSFEECADTLAWILSEPQRADRMRKAVLARSTRDHTWERRLEELFGLFPKSAG